MNLVPYEGSCDQPCQWCAVEAWESGHDDFVTVYETPANPFPGHISDAQWARARDNHWKIEELRAAGVVGPAYYGRSSIDYDHAWPSWGREHMK